MKGNISKVSKMAWAPVLAILLLTACGQKMEAPETVLQKAKEAIVEIESGDVKVGATLEGSSDQDNLGLTAALNLKFDKRVEGDQSLAVSFEASGSMKNEDQLMDGEVSAEFITVDKEYYLRLNELDSSDPNLDQIKPFLDLYSDRWLRIDEAIIPENIRELNTDDAEVQAKKEQLKALFVETKLFEVSKEFGVESLGGEDVYHYGVTPDLDGFRSYVMGAARIDGVELTNQEIEEAVEVLSHLKNVELYVDTDDYFIRKAVFEFSGAAVDQQATLDAILVVEGQDFNEAIEIEAPAGAEDFNPIELLMAFSEVPTMEVPADGSMVDEMIVTEEKSPESEEKENQ